MLRLGVDAHDPDPDSHACPQLARTRKSLCVRKPDWTWTEFSLLASGGTLYPPGRLADESARSPPLLYAPDDAALRSTGSALYLRHRRSPCGLQWRRWGRAGGRRGAGRRRRLGRGSQHVVPKDEPVRCDRDQNPAECRHRARQAVSALQQHGSVPGSISGSMTHRLSGLNARFRALKVDASEELVRRSVWHGAQLSLSMSNTSIHPSALPARCNQRVVRRSVANRATTDAPSAKTDDVRSGAPLSHHIV